MAKKRKSSEVNPQAGATASMAHASTLANDRAQAFNDLCRAAQLGISIDGSKSPGQGLQERESKLWSAYKFLSWKNPGQLSEEIENYLSSLALTPGYEDRTKRFELLLERLTDCAIATPKTDRFTKLAKVDLEMPTISEPTQMDEHLPEPSSPTPSSAKPTARSNLKSTFRTTKAGASRSSSLVEPVIQKSLPATTPPERTAPSIKDRNQTTLSFAALPGQPSLKPATAPVVSREKPGPGVNATTSFASTTANTSFGQGHSFWSSQGTQQSFRTDATSFSEDMPPPPPLQRRRDQDSIGASSLASSTAAEWLHIVEQVDASQNSSSTDKTVRPARPALTESADSSEYLTAPTSPLADQVLRPRRAPIDVTSDGTSDDFGSSLGTSTMAEWEDVAYRCDEATDHGMPNVDQVPSEMQADHPFRGGVAGARHPADHMLPRPRAVSSFSNVFVDLSDLQSFCQLSFDVQWEVGRVLQAGRISASALDRAWPKQNMQTLLELLADRGIPYQKPPAIVNLKPWETLTRTARLEWSTMKFGPVCKLVLLTLRRDTSCSLQRKLGADRVLYVDIPDMVKIPAIHRDRDVQRSFREWISTPKDILGRKWHLLFLQPNKKKTVGEGRHSTSAYRLIFVASSPTMSLCDIAQWCLPYSTNKKQAARKAYMRIELLLSRTISATVLQPGEIAHVPDQVATREHDDRRYEDPNLSHRFYEEYDPEMVMSDGCNRMSYWIAYQYSKKLCLKRVPATMQIRAAGAKGLWYIDEPAHGDPDIRPAGPLLNLAPSQVKVHRDTFYGCDEETLSVNVVKANPGARPSLLHIGYLPILVDRGVPLENIRTLVRDLVTRQTDGFLEALAADGSLRLRQWIASHNEFFEARRREAGIDLLAGFPKALEERIIQMLEAGFAPKQNKYLASEVKMLASSYFDLKNKNFKIELPKSTTLWGIAEPKTGQMRGKLDPTGSLRPGEVCVCFEEPFDVADVGTRVNFLDDIDILVARNPAMGPSDIQKVRAVFKPQLAKYAGNIIFSARGMRPLANKLQGGDYDGDAFWFTWEPLLTEPFKNAPAPWKPPDPDQLGITKDKYKLSDHVDDPNSEQQWCRYLSTMAAKRMDANMLGIVTLFHERLVYAGLPIGSEEVMRFVYLHDYLVDADKQGYDFSQADFDAYKASRPLPRNLPEPKYWQFTRSQDKNQQKNEIQGRLVGQAQTAASAIDTIFFDVVQPIVESALIRASVILEPAASYDPDLAEFWKETFESTPRGSEMAAELLKLKDRLRSIHGEWSSDARKYDTWVERIEALRASYDAIQPSNPHNPIMVEFLRRVGRGFTRWDELKASCFAANQFYSVSRPGLLVMSVAGAEMCHLKLQHTEDASRSMLLSHYRSLKLRRVRQVDSADDFDDGDGDGDAVIAVGDAAYY